MMRIFKMILIIAALVTFVPLQNMAQSEAKIFVVVNKSDWCRTCVRNSERALAFLNKSSKEMALEITINDLSNDESEAESMAKLKELGLEEAFARRKNPAIIYFFNAETKKIITQIGISKSDEDIGRALAQAMKMVE